MGLGRASFGEGKRSTTKEIELNDGRWSNKSNSPRRNTVRESYV